MFNAPTSNAPIFQVSRPPARIGTASPLCSPIRRLKNSVGAPACETCHNPAITLFPRAAEMGNGVRYDASVRRRMIRRSWIPHTWVDVGR